MAGAGIIGLGHYAPQKIVTNKELEQRLQMPAEVILERCGIRQRHIAAPEEATSDLALQAARKALADAGVEASELNLIIVATSTSDRLSPGSAVSVQAGLGATKAAAFDLLAACSGFVYGLVMGCQLIKSGLYKKVLVIGAETVSKFVDWQDANTSILFGDGAGAAVLGEVPDGYGLLGSDLGTDGTEAEVLQIPAGGSRLPASAETVAKGLHYTAMDGQRVFIFALRTLGASVKRSLEAAGLDVADVDLLVPHQANLRIIESAVQRLQFPMEKTFINLERYGNTAAASIPIALSEMKAQGHLARDQRLALVGFGAGLTWGSCVLKWY